MELGRLESRVMHQLTYVQVTNIYVCDVTLCKYHVCVTRVTSHTLPARPTDHVPARAVYRSARVDNGGSRSRGGGPRWSVLEVRVVT